MLSKFKMIILSTLLLVSISAFSQKTFHKIFCGGASTISFFENGSCLFECNNGLSGTYTLSSFGKGNYHVYMYWENGFTFEGNIIGNKLQLKMGEMWDTFTLCD